MKAKRAQEKKVIQREKNLQIVPPKVNLQKKSERESLFLIEKKKMEMGQN